jgi:hypothetical protein
MRVPRSRPLPVPNTCPDAWAALYVNLPFHEVSPGLRVTDRSVVMTPSNVS